MGWSALLNAIGPISLPQFVGWAGALASGDIARQTPKHPIQPISKTPLQPLPSGLSNLAYAGAYIGRDNLAYPRNAPLSSIPKVMPKRHQALPGLVVYINGVEQSAALEDTSLQNIADATQTPAVGIYNATQGIQLDLEHAIDDRLNVGDNPAFGTCASLIYSYIKQGKPLRFLGYSQGAIIISRALMEVGHVLEDQGMSLAQVTSTFKKYITVETMAGGTNYYPDGPFYVHYVNREDPVQYFSEFALGLKAPFTHPGAGAVNILFTKGPLWFSHALSRTYLPQYVLLQTLQKQHDRK
jgi:hypothetical protein